MRLKHDENKVKPVSEPVECPECKKMMANELSLSHHMASIHPKTEPSFLCHLCINKYHTQKSLESHISLVHSGKEFVCKYKGCGVKYKRKNSLKDHISREHENVRHQCDMCPASFRVKEFVKRHKEATHLGYRYNCVFPGCSLVYKHRPDIKNHLWRHHTKDPVELQEYTKLVWKQKPHIVDH